MVRGKVSLAECLTSEIQIMSEPGAQVTIPYFSSENVNAARKYHLLNTFLSFVYQSSQSKEIKAEIIKINYGLVKRVASSYQSNRHPIEDLIQIGLICLMDKIVDKFNPSLNYAFSTYATPHLKGAMMRHLQKTSHTIYVPAQIQRNYSTIRKIRQKQYEKTGDDFVSLDELSKESELSEEKVTLTLRAYAQQPTSIDRQIFSLSRPLSEYVADPNTVRDDFSEDTYRMGVVAQVLSTLEPDVKTVVVLHYIEGYTQREIQAKLGISLSAVRTCLTKALRTLRRMCPALIKADFQLKPSKNYKVSKNGKAKPPVLSSQPKENLSTISESENAVSASSEKKSSH